MIKPSSVHPPPRKMIPSGLSRPPRMPKRRPVKERSVTTPATRRPPNPPSRRSHRPSPKAPKNTSVSPAFVSVPPTTKASSSTVNVPQVARMSSADGASIPTVRPLAGWRAPNVMGLWISPERCRRGRRLVENVRRRPAADGLAGKGFWESEAGWRCRTGLIGREPMVTPASRRAVRGASNRGSSAAVAPEALGRGIGKGKRRLGVDEPGIHDFAVDESGIHDLESSPSRPAAWNPRSSLCNSSLRPRSPQSLPRQRQALTHS